MSGAHLIRFGWENALQAARQLPEEQNSWVPGLRQLRRNPLFFLNARRAGLLPPRMLFGIFQAAGFHTSLQIVPSPIGQAFKVPKAKRIVAKVTRDRFRASERRLLALQVREPTASALAPLPLTK